MSRSLKHPLIFIVFVFFSANAFSQNLVRLSGNKLVYSPYANEGQTNTVNIIPDFSFAGYGKGGTELPVVETVITLQPQTGDCREMIQRAIDEVSSRQLNRKGFKGAVLLKKGVYPVDGIITIKSSGVVLRGEGNQKDGTILIALQKKKHDLITLQGAGEDYTVHQNTTKKITSPYVATGTRKFQVESDHSFSAGDKVVIRKTPNDKWIQDLGMAQYGWKAAEYATNYERTITAVEQNTIAIDIPIVDPIEEQYGGGVIFKADVKGRIAQSGVENLRIESAYSSDEDEEHGWNAIVLRRAENCWVKNVVAKYFGYSCVTISGMSAFNTVQDCAMIDPKSVTTGGRKYSFNIEHGSTGNLFQRCVAWGGRHDYVTGSHVPGPNVFLDCAAENTFADVGPHHRWSTGLLFDNIYGGEIRAQNRKAMGSGHGWAGVQTLFWNCSSVIKEIKVESPVGAMNWGIGCVGMKQNGKGYWESWGSHVTPRSLYLQQLEERLGKQAVKNITTDEQRSGVIWDKLRSWASVLVEENKIMIP